MFVLRLYTLITGIETLLGELKDYSQKAIADFLADNIVENIELLKGNTLVYRYSDQIPKTHLVEVSKMISNLQSTYRYTSYKGEVDNTLSYMLKVTYGEYGDNLKLMFPHLSEDKLAELALEAEKIQKQIATLNARMKGLQPTLMCPFSLYHKDSTKLTKN